MIEPLAIVGPPGTGKTHTLIEIVRQRLKDGVPPNKVAFLSFSKKAAEEARSRAIDELSIDSRDLVHFRTLHSLAFRHLNLKRDNVLSAPDYNKLEELLGVEFRASRGINLSDGEFFRFGSTGDMYLSILNMARTRGVATEEQFNHFNNMHLDYRQMRVIETAYEEYKRQTKKIDFVDMISGFIDSPDCPKFDLLIIDEAQDLVPLQWDMVDKLVHNAKETVYAGDDDQAIYEWMGVNPSDFIKRCTNKKVLDKSYRVPRIVHDFSSSLIHRVTDRVDKNWNPTDREGSISFHYSFDEIDMSQGEWLILCRTNYIANQIGGKMKDWGLLFWREGAGYSVSTRVLTAAQTWTRLMAGKTVGKPDVEIMLYYTKQDKHERKIHKVWLDAIEEGVTRLDLEKLDKFSSSLEQEKKWYEVLDVPERERIYIQSVLRAGERFGSSPRIRLSTIHKAKGGESENVVLFLDSSRACQTLTDEDCERRVFYVGMTRAKENLHIIEGSSKWSFKI